jgi:exodeoxyribonuclease V alpha subunit
MQHYLMLSRNLLYTGLTRAKKLAIVIGAKKAIAIALNQTNQQQRYTSLQQRLAKTPEELSRLGRNFYAIALPWMSNSSGLTQNNR